ncbi:hypothetical protein AVEN_74047-1 [Araneus ventricosus]|uniref:Uncharacterized protein n=1 Tax=Araneus ventricosus TaxID=182803 RepID=A0A4Y2J2I2_ARAVE|nr:hypothetical protein AVEN_74047-1 [Araneus ventricosus]
MCMWGIAMFGYRWRWLIGRLAQLLVSLGLLYVNESVLRDDLEKECPLKTNECEIPVNSDLDLVSRIATVAATICEKPALFENVLQSMRCKCHG